MHPVAKFLSDLCLLIYLCLQSFIYAFIPKYLIWKELRNEIVLVTGGGNGIGRRLAIKLSVLGCRVVVWDVKEKDGKETVKLIKERGREGHYYFCDITNRKEVYSTAVKVKNEIGSVSIVINNAGIVTGESLLKCPDDSIERTFQVNSIAHFWVCKSFLPDMISKNHGHIVTIASLAGYFPLCDLTDYCSSKGAAISFHETLYAELMRDKCFGIKTTLVCPHHVNTSLLPGFKISALPSLETEYVAEKIISSIRSNEEVVFIPGYFKVLFALKSIFPFCVTMKAFEMLNAFNAMENFVRHKQN